MKAIVREVLLSPTGTARQQTALKRVFTDLVEDDLLPCVEAILATNFPEISVQDRRAAIEVSRRAYETMSGNEYHSPEHAFLVALATLVLTENYVGASPSSFRLRFILFISALGHDILHDGRPEGNSSFDLEKKAAKEVCAILKDHGFCSDEVEAVRLLIWATKARYRRDLMNIVDLAEMGCLISHGHNLLLPPELEEISRDPVLARLAGTLSDADLFFSVSVDLDTSLVQSKRVSLEAERYEGRKSGIPEINKRRYFFEHFSIGVFASNAGQRFQCYLNDLWEDAFGVQLGSDAVSFAKRRRDMQDRDRLAIRKAVAFFCSRYGGFRSMTRRVSGGHLFLESGRHALILTRSGLVLSGVVTDQKFSCSSFITRVKGAVDAK